MTEPAPQNIQAVQETAARDEVVPIMEGIMDGCPVQPLGRDASEYFFIDASGQMITLSARDFSDRHLLSLFGGDDAWLRDKFPEYDRKNQVKDFNAKAATKALMYACRMKGIYDPGRPTRWHGVWRYRDKPLVHAGDFLFYDGKEMPAGQRMGSDIYEARAGAERPDFAQALDATEALEIREMLDQWNFGEAGDADLLFGFIAAALLGGFPHWRVHVLIHADRGSGKSTLGELIFALLGPMAELLTDYTEAGVRQSFQRLARAVVLDEADAESEFYQRRLASVIRLLRQMSGGQGARIARGTAGGSAHNMTVMGCALIIAINPPELEPQDSSRILEISLKPLSGGDVDIEGMMQRARELSARLRGRAILRAGHFTSAFAMYRKSLLEHACDPRRADMFATLLAGRSMLLYDGEPQLDFAKSDVAQLQERLRVIMIADSEGGNGEKCLNHLFDHFMENIRQDRKVTIGGVIEAAAAGDGDQSPLYAYGMKLGRDAGGRRQLFIPTTHLQLKRVFAGTAWGGGGWNKAVKRLPGVEAAEPQNVMGSRRRRGVWIPDLYLPKAEREGLPTTPSGHVDYSGAGDHA